MGAWEWIIVGMLVIGFGCGLMILRLARPASWADAEIERLMHAESFPPRGVTTWASRERGR